MIDKEDEGCQDPHESGDDACPLQADLGRVLLGSVLGGNLTEDQDQEGEDTGGNAGTHAAEDPDGQRSGERGCGEVDDVVTNQDGREHLLLIRCDGKNLPGPLITIVGQGFHSGVADGGQGSLCRREEG